MDNYEYVWYNGVVKTQGEVQYSVDFDKYIERLDQDRRESEVRLKQNMDNLEQHLREDRQLMERRLVEERRLSEERLSKNSEELKADFRELRNEFRETKRWIIGIGITTVLGIAGLAAAVIISITQLA